MSKIKLENFLEMALSYSGILHIFYQLKIMILCISSER